MGCRWSAFPPWEPALLEAGLGAIVADDDDGLTGAVLSVLRDAGLSERLRREARTVAAGWSVERTTDELLSVYGAAMREADRLNLALSVALVAETFPPEVNGVARTLERLVSELSAA